MRKITLVICMLLALICVSGCDFFRTLARRPTSAELKVLKNKVEAEKSRADSLAKCAQRQAAMSAMMDSVTFARSLRALGVSASTVQRLSGLDTSEVIPATYCTIIGMFRNQDNCDRLCDRLVSAGFVPVRLRTKSGLTAIGADPTDNPDSLLSSYSRLSKESFCPDGAWILVNK